jgi:hypothetical protein
MGGAHADLMDDIGRDVNDILSQTMTPDQQNDVYCQALGRLERATERGGGGKAVQAELDEEREALERHIVERLGLPRRDIDRRLGLVGGLAAPAPLPTMANGAGSAATDGADALAATAVPARASRRRGATATRASAKGASGRAASGKGTSAKRAAGRKPTGGSARA